MNTLKITAQQSGMATQRKIALAIYVAAVIGLGVLSLPLLFAFFIPITVGLVIAMLFKLDGDVEDGCSADDGSMAKDASTAIACGPTLLGVGFAGKDYVGAGLLRDQDSD